MKDQLERETPVIIETGTLREPGNWLGDGQSTRLWQWIVEHKGGMAISVDLDIKAYLLAQRECPNVCGVCSDSITFLRGTFLPFPPTLLYLDSIEWGETRASSVNCWMNQIGELAAIWRALPSGCLIASDDNNGRDNNGKPVFTHRIFEAMQVKPEYDGYVIVWRKP